MAGILGPYFTPLPGPARPKPTKLIDYLVQNYQPGQPAPQTISAGHVPMRDKLEQGIASALDYVMPKGKAEERAAKIVNLLDLGAPINPVAAYDSAYDSGKAYAQGRPWASAGNMGLAALAAGGFGGGLKVTGNELAKGIRAYHGSPHDFERFSLDKIGTGEGAQAYGHGLYFTSGERLANSYRRADPDKHFGPGHMYEVNINADPANLLDWDKRLTEQPEVVQELARTADLSHLPAGNRTRVLLERYRAGNEQEHYPALGQHLHNALSDYGANSLPELSQRLSAAGIPGVKYGTHHQHNQNYVIFDDNLIDILRKYGLAAGAVGLSSLLAAHSQPAQAETH